MNHSQNIDSLAAGTVLRVSHGFYDHVGLVSDIYIDGERAVISFAAATSGLTEEPFSAFSKRRVVYNDGYLGQLAPYWVIARARANHHRRYSWTTYNCEHFVRDAHGLKPESPQLQSWVAMGSIVGFVLAAAR